ncbi:potassium channel protein [Candidatus Sumerlaeota bacterium]|nr:potassium channel protein [Candidatus Sumerlaeota bacterium]
MIDRNSILYRLRNAITLFLLVLAVGTASFMFILKLPFLDAFYFTVVTLATVGYGDIQPTGTAARLFTTIFILGGIGTASYSISVLMALVIEGQVQGELKRRRMLKEIQKLSNHIILCGFGRIGNELAESFAAEKVPFVIIERDEAALAKAEALGYPVLAGDATADETLCEAGIDRARAIVPALASDADNLFIVISARQLNPKLFIVARATDDPTEAKMCKAGADKIVRPLYIGAHHLAQAVLRPTVLDFVQVSGKNKNREYRIEELAVAENSAMSCKTLLEINLRKEVGVILIGIKRAEGDLVFNPSAETEIHGGDTIVAMGDEPNLNKLRNLAGARS